MSSSQALTSFAKKFVMSKFQERFVHEATKKPSALHRRVCHDISEMFEDKYCGQNPTFVDSDSCFFLGWSSPFEEISWKTAKEKMSSGGGGYLVIKTDGTAFYAETEGYPPTKYSNGS